MPRNGVRLYVEGSDDSHFIKHFLKKRGGRDLKFQDELVSCEGKVIERIPAIAKESAPTRIGLILDADRDPDKRWARIREEFAKAWGERFLPEQPEGDSTIVQLPGLSLNRRLDDARPRNARGLGNVSHRDPRQD